MHKISESIQRKLEQAKHSSFRRALAVSSTPLSEQTMNRIKFTEAAMLAVGKNPIVFMEAVKRVMKLGLNMPIDDFVLSVGASGSDPHAFLKVLNDHGISAFSEKCVVRSGMLLSKKETQGVVYEVAALTSNPFETISGQRLNEPIERGKHFVYVDTIEVIDALIFIMNFCRFYEFEQIASTCLTNNEMGQYSNSQLKDTLSKRLAVLRMKPEELDHEALRVLFRELCPTTNAYEELEKVNFLNYVRYLSLSCEESYTKDERAHLLNLLNADLRSYILGNVFTCLELDRIRKSARISKTIFSESRVFHEFHPLVEVMMYLVDIAYGETWLRLSKLQNALFKLDGYTADILRQYIFPGLGNLAGCPHTGDALTRFMPFFRTSKDRMREIALELLDEIGRDYLGINFRNEYPAERFSELRKIQFVSKDQLPFVLGLWAQKYCPELLQSSTPTASNARGPLTN